MAGSECPDLRPFFKHVFWREMPHSHGVLVGSDWSDKTDDDPTFGVYRRCGFWTMDEVAILYDVARQLGGMWLDIGGHTGWTSAHLALAGCSVVAIDPMYRLQAFRDRSRENLLAAGAIGIWRHPGTSEDYFATDRVTRIDGSVIDGEHTAPMPLQDAIGSAQRMKAKGAILFHDAVGAPVQDGVLWLAQQGFQKRVYPTCHGVALCWRGELEPPPYVPDPTVLAGVRGHLAPILEGEGW
jgi:hypothetical protein